LEWGREIELTQIQHGKWEFIVKKHGEGADEKRLRRNIKGEDNSY
jgi:hypothetical protein